MMIFMTIVDLSLAKYSRRYPAKRTRIFLHVFCPLVHGRRVTF